MPTWSSSAQIYSAADVYVNPSVEETFGLTPLEAQACGTRVVTYDTGGSPETLNDTGIVVPKGDLAAAINAFTL